MAKKKPAPKKASPKKVSPKKKSVPAKKAAKKKAVPKKAAPKNMMMRDLKAPTAWRAWCDSEAKWIGPWQSDKASADQDALPHINANHTVEIKLQF
jgi:hypothetical protein